MRVLLVEDSARLQQSVGTALRKAGFAVDIAPDGEEGLWMAESNDYDVLILDLMLPKMDGLTVLQRLRDAGKDVHVLILTAKDTVEDRVRGLTQGADDYLVKPFALEELLARAQALARRRYQVKNPRVKLGDLELDTASRTVYRRGEVVPLPPRDYALLEYLVLRRGEVVTRTEIERHIYDDRVEPKSNVVETAIYALRRRLNLPESSLQIQTRRGMGYMLTVSNATPEPECAPSAAN